jgi:hypothetical protein
MRAIVARERAMAKIGWRILAVSALIAWATPLSAGQVRTVGPGGIAMGAVIGVPLGGPYYHPGYAPIVGYEPFSFDAPFPVPCPGGYWAHRPLVDRWGHQFGYSAPRFFCP